MDKKFTCYCGLILCALYFATVVIFVATSSLFWQIIFEIVTMLSGVYFVFFILALPFSKDEKKQIYGVAASIFAAALMLLTNIAHAVSLTMIRLIQNGVIIPDFWQIGKMPSVVTAIEYLGWGLFLGLAFLFSAFGIEHERKFLPLKICLFLCAGLCFAGYFGALLNENLWYIAPIAYGLGTAVLCVKILSLVKQEKKIGMLSCKNRTLGNQINY